MSMSTAPVAEDQHQRWFAATLQNPDRLLFIGFRPELPRAGIGVVRFDIRRSEHQAEVNINLSEDFHGQGLGAPLLAAGIRAFAGREREIHRVLAKVKPENLASQRCFERCGFAIDPARDAHTLRAYILSINGSAG